VNEYAGTEARHVVDAPVEGLPRMREEVVRDDYNSYAHMGRDTRRLTSRRHRLSRPSGPPCDAPAMPAHYATRRVGALVDDWMPALDGAVHKLNTGAAVAEVGCGHGSTLIPMAQAFPCASFRGIDVNAEAIAEAQQRAEHSGAAWRISFEIAAADSFTGGPYDLVTVVGLHGTDNPIRVARHVRKMIADDGIWIIVEPHAAGMHSGCTLGHQSGPARIRDVVTAARFTHFRLAVQTPLSTVFEVRP
jgi:2-polyprenyl-3-methyl-5-hydroxy-6-metoxy-1,4-benzoquinol methylase